MAVGGDGDPGPGANKRFGVRVVLGNLRQRVHGNGRQRQGFGSDPKVSRAVKTNYTKLMANAAALSVV